jgi:3-deoxy-manno-octulosonate cytidylyltransferase (CMP-KDO synthetase)
MSFTVVIPARLNSTRLENKLLLEIKNKPLFIHTAEQVSKSKATNIYIATDNQSIKDIAENFGFMSIMTAESHQSGTDRINEAAQILSLEDDHVLVNVQGDEPLVDFKLINELAENISNHNQFVSAYQKFKSFEDYKNKNNVKVALNVNNEAITFSRSMIGNLNDENFIDDLIYHHLGIYAYTVKQINDFCQIDSPKIEKVEKLEQMRAIFNDIPIKMIEYHGEEMIGVDTIEDFNKVKILLG